MYGRFASATLEDIFRWYQTPHRQGLKDTSHDIRGLERIKDARPSPQLVKLAADYVAWRLPAFHMFTFYKHL